MIVKSDNYGAIVTTAETAALTDVQTDLPSSSPDSFERVSSRYFARRASPTTTSPVPTDYKFHRVRSAILRFEEAEQDASGNSKSVAKCQSRTDATACKFHRTRSAVLRDEDTSRSTVTPQSQTVRFNLGVDADEASTSTRPSGGKAKGPSTVPSSYSAVRTGSEPSPTLLVTSVDVNQQSRFHRSRSAVMHRGSLPNEETSFVPKPSPTRSLKTAMSQSPNVSPVRERSTVHIQQLQQPQQVPRIRTIGSKSSSSSLEPRLGFAAQALEPAVVKTSISDLGNENYTRFHRIRAAAQLQQAAGTSSTSQVNRKKDLAATQNELIR